MALHPAQKEIINDIHRFRVLRCGRRFGKTLLIAKEIKAFSIAKPSRIAYIANNYQQARDIAWEMFKKELEGAIIDTNEQRLEIRVRTQTKEESTIVLRGWESVENLRGQAFDFLTIDEVAMMRNFWVNWYEVLRPTLTDTKGGALFASTPKGYNHFYDLCNLELTDKDFKSFHFTSYDNPYIDKAEIDEAQRTIPDDRFAQEYLASFQKTQGLVYKEFSREINLYETLPKGHFNKYAGIDFGYRNPAAVLDIYFNGERVYVEEEWYKRGKTDADIADYVAQGKYESTYPDPENQGGIEELKRKSVKVKEVNKGKGRKEAGIQMIRELLMARRLYVNKRCINLISEFEMYSYDEKKDERNENEEPIKSNDHALDALRYTICSLLPIIEKRETMKGLPKFPPRERKNIAL